MIQVDPDNPARSYVRIADAHGQEKSEHETIYGLSPAEARDLFRRALVDEQRRRASRAVQSASAGARRPG